MRKIILLTSTLFMLLVSSSLFATPVLPGGDIDVPVDGGISLLLGAGAIYGMKKIKENKRK